LAFTTKSTEASFVCIIFAVFLSKIIINGYEMVALWNFKFSYILYFNICHTVAEILEFFVFLKMAAAAILDFQKLEILTVAPLYGPNVCHRTEFHQNRSS